MDTTVRTWLDAALRQMAAECYLDGIDFQNETQIAIRLQAGNNDIRNSNIAALDPNNLPGKTRFTDEQIKYFNETWQIVDHRPDLDDRFATRGIGNGTGFSATLFVSRTGEYTLSFRSTEYADDDKGGDWLRDGVNGADGDIVKKGFAFGQILAMEDYYKWLTSGPDPLLPESATLNVTGYSLGGHLATVFTELHADKVNHTYTFNSAGRGQFDRNSGDLSDMVDFFRAQLGDSVSQTNVYNDARYIAAVEATRQAFDTRGVSLPQGSTGLDFQADLKISQLFGHSTHGDAEWVANSGVHAAYPVPIFIEDQPDVQGFVFDFLDRILNIKSDFGGTHSITLIADSLALMEVLQQLDPNITMGQMGAILASASHQRAAGFIGTQGKAEGDSLENVLQALLRLYVGENTDLTFDRNGGGFGNLVNRNKFYDAIAMLNNKIAGSGGGMVVNFVPVDQFSGDNGEPISTVVIPPGAGVINLAKEGASGLAYRYALKELNSFAVDNSALYADYTEAGGYARGNLDSFDPATRKGAVTGKYIEDRAAFLERKLWFSVQDLEPLNDQARYDQSKPRSFANEPLSSDYRDIASKYEILQDKLYRSTRVYAFGSDDSGDYLSGQDLEDHLYGGGGSDVLTGGKGDDYLEGGAGLDVYEFKPGDGNDTILDTDGKGLLRYAYGGGSEKTIGVIADASLKLDENLWQSADGKFSYTKQGADLLVSFIDAAGGSLLLKDWREGDFFIQLREEIRTANLLRIDGDRAPVDQNPSTPEIDATVDALGNVVTDPNAAQPGRADVLYGQDGTEGGDWIVAGAGRDRIDAKGGGDLVEGGEGGTLDAETGGDLIDGGVGDDWLYGDIRLSLADAIRLGATELSTGQKGDWLSGHAGNDVLVGSAGNDVLVGGSGADLLVGGAGNDSLGGDADWTQIHFGWTVEDYGTYQSFPGVSGEAHPLDDEGDTLYGGAGDDTAWGGRGDDLIFGEAGADRLYGQWGSDILIGGEGNDELHGDYDVAAEDHGADVLDGGDGDDKLYGDGGDDVLIGGRGNDILIGGAGKDTYIFNRGDGRDTVFDDSSGPEKSVLVFGEGFDKSTLTLRPGSMLLDFGSGDAIDLAGFDHDDPNAAPVFKQLAFADGSTLSFDEVLAMGFTIDGTEDDDNGHDAAHPMLVGTAFIDRIRGLGGNDILFGLQGDDTLDGGAGDDQLQGNEGNDTLHGGDGDDYLFGQAGNDVLDGGAGADWLVGDEGDDTYIFDEQDAAYDSSGNVVVQFGDGLTADDIDLSIQFFNGQRFRFLRLSSSAGGGSFSDGMSIGLDERFQIPVLSYRFADGTVLTEAQFFETSLTDQQLVSGTAADDLLLGYAGNDRLYGQEGNDQLVGRRGNDFLDGGAGDDTLEGDTGNDRLFGRDGNDTLNGGAGNDELEGGPGSDLYLFARGDGNDVIHDDGDTTAVDTLRLAAGIASTDVTLTRLANGDLRIALIGSADTVTVSDFYNFATTQIEQIEFADGSVIDSATLNGLRVAPIVGTEQNDVLSGTQYADTLLGFAGDDVLDGGQGNDTLEGGAGSDSYVLAFGGGTDTVIDDPAEQSIVRLGEGMQFTDLDAARSGDDLHLSVLDTTAKLVLPDYYAGAGNWSVRTDSGEQQSLAAVLDTIAARAAVATVDDAREAFIDSARRRFRAELASFGGRGNISVYTQQSDAATIYRVSSQYAGSTSYYILPIETVIGGASDNFFDLRYSGVMTVDAGAGNDFIYSYGWGAEGIGSFLYGNAGNDTIVGTLNDDVLHDDAGANYLAGNEGDDTYLLLATDSGTNIIDESVPRMILQGGRYSQGGAPGSSDTLAFGAGIGPGDLQLSWGTLDIDGIAPGNDHDRVYATLDIGYGTQGAIARIVLPALENRSLGGGWWGIETVRFADGTRLSFAEFSALAAPEPASEGNQDNVLEGTASADLIYGYAGDDVLSGGDGADSLYGGAGFDVIDGGAGNDLLYDSSAPDPGSFSGNNLFLGGAGDDLIRPGEINQQGRFPANIIIGGAGQDAIDIEWLQSNRWIVSFNRGDGLDTVLNPYGNFYYEGTISLGGGIDAAEVGATVAGGDLFIGTGAGEGVLLQRWASPVIPYDHNAEDLKLQIIGTDAIRTYDLTAYALNGGSLTNYLLYTFLDQALGGGIAYAYATQGSVESSRAAITAVLSAPEFGLQAQPILLPRVITGTQGADYLEGTAGNESIRGLGGNDSLAGLGGEDVLDGGAGNDWLDGGEGNDTYLFGSGYGQDNVYEINGDFGGLDRIRLSDLTPAQISVTRVMLESGGTGLTLFDESFYLLVNGSQDWLRFNAGASAVEGIEFADGTLWDEAALRARVQVPAATAFADLIGGSTGDDYIAALEGNDQVHGNEGDDLLSGQGGDDAIEGGRGNDLLFGGAGADDLQDYLGRNVLDGGAGEDYLYVEYDRAFLAGGAGDDQLETWESENVVGFNIGEGRDTLTFSQPTTISVGALDAATPIELALDAWGNVTLAFGTADAITLSNWGEDSAWSGLRLQVIGDDVRGYDLGRAVDELRAANVMDPGVTSRPLELAGYLLSTSMTEAIGGDLAWHYATLGSIAGLSAERAQSVLAAAEFALAPQAFIRPNNAPRLAVLIADQVTDEDAVFSFVVTAGTFTDADAGDMLSYSATLADGSALPAWLAFDAATHAFSGTPGNGDLGTISVRVIATDSANAWASELFDLSVTNTNDAPTVSNVVADQTATEDAVFLFQVPAGTFTDVDAGDALTYAATTADGAALPSWLAFDAATRTFSGTPVNADVGTLSVKVTATDGANAAVSDVFDIVVANTNDAPTRANAIADQTTLEDTAFSFQVPVNSFADVDVGDTLSYGATLSNGSALPSWLAFNAATRTFSGTPVNADVGTLSIKVTATDSASAAVSDIFDITVANTNDAPVALADSVAVSENATTANLIAALLSNDTDVDVGDTRGITAVNTAGTLGAVALNVASQSLTYSANAAAQDALRAGQTAIDSFSYTIADAAGAVSSATVTVTVTGVNDAPVALADSVAVNENATTANLVAALLSNDTDVDVGDTRSITAVNTTGTLGAVSFSAASQSLTYSANAAAQDALREGQTATDNFTYTMADAAGEVSSATVTVTVTGVNDAPTLSNAIADQTTLEDTALSFQVPANSFADVDVGDTLTYSATLSSGAALPSWLSFNAGTRTFSGTPSYANAGTLSVRVTATDGALLSASDDFNLTVNLYPDLVVTGTAANDSLVGHSGNDLLDGGAGADTMAGARGNDTYVVDNVGDVVTELANEGIDTVQSSVTFSLATLVNVENLTLTGTAAINGTGNTLDNILTGNSANNTLTGDAGSDTLYGGAGTDTLVGGVGNDTYIVDSTTDTITELASEGTDTVLSSVTFTTLAANVENLTLTGTSAINGTGNTLNNVLTGNAAANVLSGGTGTDTMLGGLGDDTYVVDNVGDVVTENAGEGTDLVQSSVTYTLAANVETLTLTGNGRINGTGNTLDNVITGNSANNTLAGGAGNDTLVGLGGADTMIGGTGDDIYDLDSTSDVVTENVSEGSDTIQSSVGWTLAINFENLILTGNAGINGTGNTVANLLVGNSGNNTLNGAAGNDILQGLAGNDILNDSAGNSLFDGGAGTDRMTGNANNEMFIGGLGNDAITTGTGADIIAFNKGAGQDVVNASTGADNVLSIGGGIAYAGLTFAKSGKKLILKTGGTDQITFKDWYSQVGNRSVAKLQVFTEAMPGYNPGGSDTLLDNKVEQFNFTALANAFDAAGQVNGWALTNALLSAHLSGSDTAALGGDLAYQYGKTGSLAGIGLTPAQDVVNAAQFGSSAQTLRTLAELQQGQIRLS